MSPSPGGKSPVKGLNRTENLSMESGCQIETKDHFWDAFSESFPAYHFSTWTNNSSARPNLKVPAWFRSNLRYQLWMSFQLYHITTINAILPFLTVVSPQQYVFNCACSGAQCWNIVPFNYPPCLTTHLASDHSKRSLSSMGIHWS